MDDLEKKIATLPFPEISKSACQRIETLLPVDSSNSLTPGSRMFKRITRPLIAVAGLLLIGFAADFLISSATQTDRLFADVQKAMKKVHTMEYTFKSVWHKGLDSIPVRQPDYSYRQVTDIPQHAQTVTRSLRAILAAEKSPKTRRELQNQIEITKHHSDKANGRLQWAFLGRLSKGRKRYEQFFPFDQVSLDTFNSSDEIKRMTTVPPDATKPLGESTIDQHRAIGFRLIESMNDGIVYRDYWVDAQTLLPIRIEHSWRKSETTEPTEISVYNNFVFNVPIKETLFDKSSLGRGDTSSLPSLD
ncbi:hypothetical protein [Planctomycetes bacterium K23_9]|uniref:Uncharacterized protein n=1 Tax=Stieleria marina TaxID=1930275 RepID=A0A517NWM5_9BACT|nr:hypothetical protein K239x_35330 [Planctomycetes bacterium K23_9]